MAGYRAPKKHLHRDFIYLDHESVVNSLSAFEAGDVDQIIEKVTEGTDHEAGGALNFGAGKGKLARRKEVALQEELVRKRTWFSAFDAWDRALEDADAYGSFDHWDLAVRDQLKVGHTLRFEARVRLSPVDLLLATIAEYAKDASPQSATFKVNQTEAAKARAAARVAEAITSGHGGSRSLSVYFEPEGSPTDTKVPRIVGKIDETYLLRGRSALSGVYTIVAQVEALLAPDEEVSVVRFIRDTPATPAETKAIRDGLAAMSVPAKGMGVEIDEDDIGYVYPAVVVRPIAIYR